jgi:PleD family two-component response regulator
MAARSGILIAAPADVIRRLGAALADDAEISGAETWDQALERLDEQQPQLIIVCYAFDEMRPFRLVHYVRHEWQATRANVPTILVRALPVPLRKTQEDQIRESYKTLGVDEFFNLHDEGERRGSEEALQEFRESVIRRLPMTPDAPWASVPKNL